MKLNSYYSVYVCGFILGLILTSCDFFGSSNFSDPAGEKDIYHGKYTQGIENSNFIPCLKEDESWELIEIKDTTFVQKVISVGENPIYMEIKGTPGPRGEYKGIFKIYDRQIEVEKVIKAESLQKNDC